MKLKIVRNVVSGEHLTYERFRIMECTEHFLSDVEVWDFVRLDNNAPIEFTSESALRSFIVTNFGVNRIPDTEYDHWDEIQTIEPKLVTR